MDALSVIINHDLMHQWFGVLSRLVVHYSIGTLVRSTQASITE